MLIMNWKILFLVVITIDVLFPPPEKFICLYMTYCQFEKRGHENYIFSLMNHIYHLKMTPHDSLLIVTNNKPQSNISAY